MRHYLIVFFTIVAAGFIGMSLVQQNAPQVEPSYQLAMSSNPFPPSVGPTTLLIALSDDAGNPIDGADLTIHGDYMADGAIPVDGYGRSVGDGLYEVHATWSRFGIWLVEATATLEDQVIEDTFEVFVYAVPTSLGSKQTHFRSIFQRNETISVDPEREYHVVIPNGANELIKSGRGNDVIPEEIVLSLSGKNVLIIENNDVVDHIVGPFFVRSGEAVRQEYTEPMVYVGTCSIRYSAQFNIVVEE